MEIVFLDGKPFMDGGSVPQEKIALEPDKFIAYALQYALEQTKEIKDPEIAAKEFKEKANAFINALIKQ